MKHILTISSFLLCVHAMNAQTDNVTRKRSQKQTTTQVTTAPKKQSTTVTTAKKQSPTTSSSPRSSSSDSANSNSSSQPIDNSSYTLDVKTFYANGVSFQMVEVQGGTFKMGGTSEQGSDIYDDEKPIHSVTLSSYYIGKYEVTQELWQAVMGNNPSNSKGNRKPVECVSWNDCKTFIAKLNSLTGKNFRLPTEAEWEFASRGGKKSKGYKYSGSNIIENVAWYSSNARYQTHDVGTKSSNELGIYDMSGNVWEWCSDWYGNYSSNAQSNPTGPSSGSYRVFRGGSSSYDAGRCRSSTRCDNAPVFVSSNLGLRLCLSE